MGAEVQAQSYTREERQRYREKVRQNLDVFERMLTTSSFEFDRPMTGLEIELNLVDTDMQPHFHNEKVLHAIADASYQTELAQYNIELNVPPRPLPGDSALELEEELRDSLNAADRAAKEVGSKIVAIGILPTIMPEHFEGEWISANNRYTALNDSIFVARGEDIYLDIEGPTGERVATYCDSIAPESACTSVQLHLQVAPSEFAAHWNAAQALAAPQVALAANSPFFFGKRLHAETRIELFKQATDTRPDRAEEPGRAAPRLLRRALDHLDLRPVRGERPLLPDPARRDQRRGPDGLARGRHRPRAVRAAAAQRHRLPLEPADLRHRRRHAAPARREPRAAGRPDHRRRAGQRRVLLRRHPHAGPRGPPGLDAR